MSSELKTFGQLLSVLAIGFAQGLFALDAADGSVESPYTVSRFKGTRFEMRPLISIRLLMFSFKRYYS